MTVSIPVKIGYDGSGWNQLSRDAKKAEAEMMRITRNQIQAHRTLLANTARLDKSLSTERQTKQAQRDQMVGTVAGAALAGGAAAGAFLFDASQAARESAAAEAQLATVLQSTNHAAGVQQKELTELASRLQDLTNFTDEEVIKAEALLLTFTKVGSSVFPAATKAALDMAEALDTDVKSASIQVGKALNDPINGLTALSRAGVSFTQSQKDQIKAMVEAGNVAGAQQVILAELNKEFGGQAEAARTAAGGLKDLEVAWGNFQETIGGATNDLGLTDSVFAAGTVTIEKLDTAVKGIAADLAYLGGQAGKTGVDWQGAGDSFISFAEQAGAAMNKTGGLGTVAAAGINIAVSAARRLEDEQAKATQTTKEFTGATDEATTALEEDAKAAEKARQALEKRQKIQRDAARDLIRIDEETTEEGARIWDEFGDDVSRLNQDTWKSLEKIQADSAGRQKANQKKLAQDLAKVNQDLGKDLARLQRDSARDITRKQEDYAREDRATSRQAQLSALGDERLFQLELRNMAEEGDAIGIRRALERREIEGQIAREKAAEEAQIEDEKRQVELDRMREDTRTRADDMREDAETRKQELITEAAEEEVRRQEELRKAIDEENAAYDERLLELQTYREEKLATLEESRLESIEALGRELAEAQELTAAELGKLVTVAGEYGQAAGNAFAEGLSAGMGTVAEINSQLGTGGDFNPMNVKANTRGQVPGFDNGGIVPGPVGAPMLAIVHGGEEVRKPGQGGVTMNINGPGMEKFAAYLKAIVDKAVSEYDEELSQVLN